MDMQLEHQVVVVAGSSRGIGRAMAESFLCEGARVVLSGRDANSLEEARRSLETQGHLDRVLAVAGDLSTPRGVAALYEATQARFGRIDHLVANLGTGTGDGSSSPAEEEWQRLFEQNFHASVRLTQAALPYLHANDAGGSILHVASIVALEASGAPLPYAAAKAALLNYSKNLSRRVSAQRVRVNAICPGNVLFPGGSWQRRLNQEPDAVQAMLELNVPQRRFGNPEEIASLAVYLCSPQAAFCTGGCYVVDGGQTRAL